MIVVSDTPVITSLIHIGREQLLAELHGRVLIPPAVQQELLRTHIQIPHFLEVQSIHDPASVARLKTELDLGEAEAIVLAKESKADLLLIDEKLGRQIAMREGLRISGLPGLCSAISQHRRVLRRFSRSADSLVREFHATPKRHADKAVRAPLVAAKAALCGDEGKRKNFFTARLGAET